MRGIAFTVVTGACEPDCRPAVLPELRRCVVRAELEDGMPSIIGAVDSSRRHCGSDRTSYVARMIFRARSSGGN